MVAGGTLEALDTEGRRRRGEPGRQPGRPQAPLSCSVPAIWRSPAQQGYGFLNEVAIIGLKGNKLACEGRTH